MAKAHAFMEDRDYVIPDDVKAVIMDVFKHRLILTPAVRREKHAARKIIESMLQEVKEPSLTGERTSY